MIFGFGRVGRMVADMLVEHDRPYLAVDSDVDAVNACARATAMTCCSAMSARPELVERLNLGEAAALVLTMDDPVLVARIARRVRAALSRFADHRPRPRHRPRGAALQGRGDRRGARNARSLAAAGGGGAGRHRRGDGPGHRQHPRKTRRSMRAEIMAEGELDEEPGARPAAAARRRGRLRPRPSPARRGPRPAPRRPCRRRGRRPGPCRDGRRRPARPAPRPRP